MFDDIAGLVMGRPAYYNPKDVGTLWDVVKRRTESGGMPVMANLDFGHTDPLLTIPMGAKAFLDAGGHVLQVTEHVTTAQ